MRASANRLNNKGLYFKKSDLYKKTEQLDKMYTTYTGLLYDLGVCDNPSFCTDTDILRYLKDVAKEDITYLTSSSNGFVSLSLTVIEYFILCTSSSEARQVMQLYYYVKLAYLLQVTIDRILCKSRVQKSKDDFIGKVKYSTGTKIVDKSPLALNDIDYSYLLYRDKDTNLYTYDLREFILEELARYVGVSEADILQHKSLNKSFFCEGLSFKDEAKIVDLLITRHTYYTGKFSHLLRDKLVSHYSLNKDIAKYTKMGCDDFGDEFYRFILDKLCDKVKQVRTSLGDNYIDEFSVGKYNVTFLVTKDSSLITEPKHWETMYFVGSLALDYSTSKEFPMHIKFMGYSGEFIKESLINTNTCKKLGLPVILEGVSYYPLYRVVYADSNYDSVYKDINFAIKSIFSISSDFYISSIDLDDFSSKYNLGISSSVIDWDSLYDYNSFNYNTLWDKLFRLVESVGDVKLTNLETSIVVFKLLTELDLTVIGVFMLRKLRLPTEENINYDLITDKVKFLLNIFNHYYDYVSPKSSDYAESEYKKLCERLKVFF